MSLSVGVLKETYSGERRVAIVPAAVPSLIKAGLAVRVEAGAGQPAGFADEEFTRRGAAVASRDEAFSTDCVLAVRLLGADPSGTQDLLSRVRPGQLLIGFCEPLVEPALVARFAETGASLLAMELTPRTTRAQSMDALSSMATVAGYRAVLHAALALGKLFPLLMTAAGTLTPAKVLVIGAGVAGLQAIATARRLGAVVTAYDVRPAVKEQVESLGARFLELALDTRQDQDQRGYAKQLEEDALQRQQELMAKAVADHDVVITTAAVPGKRSPVLVTAAMVARMQPGSVVVDLAAERGGNCELTRPGETVLAHGVSILGLLNVASEAPLHASQMYAHNVSSLVQHVLRDGRLALDVQDEIVRETLVAHDGRVVHPRLAELLNIESPTIST